MVSLRLSVRFGGTSRDLRTRKRMDNVATLCESARNKYSKPSMHSSGEGSAETVSFGVNVASLTERNVLAPSFSFAMCSPPQVRLLVFIIISFNIKLSGTVFCNFQCRVLLISRESLHLLSLLASPGGSHVDFHKEERVSPWMREQRFSI